MKAILSSEQIEQILKDLEDKVFGLPVEYKNTYAI